MSQSNNVLSTESAVLLVAGICCFISGLFGSLAFVGAAWSVRQGDYACAQLVGQFADERAMNTASGGWSWWPTGVSCTYSASDGDLTSLGPDPVLSALFVLSLAFILIGIVGIVAGILRLHR